jgi:hypothetical protein
MVMGGTRESSNIRGIPKRTQEAWRKNTAKKFPSLPRAESTNDDDRTITSPKITKKRTVATITT